ncbi:unnamed protein product [Caenorhabditis angaria]|uniref:Uncharacterized protein n=1 Tax=Caenorhabditis angaria TaxID=860376 RepID=A0A9P1IMJ5_9PELO|nr:unnamed protein product [Caenorhabditis angaria]
MNVDAKIIYLLILILILFFGILKDTTLFPEMSSAKIDDRSIILKYFENFQKNGASWERNTTPQPRMNFDYLKNINSYNYSTVPEKCDHSHDFDPRKLSAIKNNHGNCEVVMLVRFWHQPDILWFNYENAMKMCDEERIVRDIQIFPFTSNLEENDMKYWAAMPKCKIDSNILLKIGGESDKSPEESLKTYIPDLQIKYIQKNPDNFTDILMKIERSNPSIIIDMLWISHDSNIDILELLINKTIQNMNIVFCQINLEVSKENAELFEKFLHSSYTRANYVGLRPSSTRNSTYRSGYYQNIIDHRCIVKFLK